MQSLIAATVVTLFTLASTVAAQAQRADAIIGLQLEPPHLDPTSAAAGAIDQVLYANVPNKNMAHLLRYLTIHLENQVDHHSANIWE